MITMYPPQNNSPRAQLAEAINAGQTTMTVDDATIFPSAPNVLTIGVSDSAELVQYTNITGNIITIVRGFNGTTAAAWDAGTYVYRAITAQDVSALQDNTTDLYTTKQDALTGLTSTVAELNILSGATISTAELNVLDGITATTQELNYSSGVTSGIQAQINTKQTSPSSATALPTSGVALSDNTEYLVSAALSGAYTFVFPATTEYIWIRVSTASDFTSVTWPTGVTVVGDDMAASHTYEIDIKDSVPLVKEIV